MNIFQELTEEKREPFIGILMVTKTTIKFAWWPTAIWITYNAKRSRPCWLWFYKEQEFMHGAVRSYAI
jgi:hypothetical protein